MAPREFVGYRHATWDTPWWVNPNRRDGRYNRRASGRSTQYVCLHPLGPAAELLRHIGRAAVADIATLTMRLWAARVPTEGLVHVTFDNAGSYGLDPTQLVGEDLTPTQRFAERMIEEGAAGLVAPSAALPGTEIGVLFGQRVMVPYLADPIDPDIEVPTGHVADGAVPGEVVPYVRWKGEAHAVLEEWLTTGVAPAFVDPAVSP